MSIQETLYLQATMKKVAELGQYVEEQAKRITELEKRLNEIESRKLRLKHGKNEV